MEMNVEVDVQKVIDAMEVAEIFDKSGMDASNCKSVLGDLLLSEFTLSDLIEYHGAVSFLDEIGEEAAIKHFDINVAEAE